MQTLSAVAVVIAARTGYSIGAMTQYAIETADAELGVLNARPETELEDEQAGALVASAVAMQERGWNLLEQYEAAVAA